MFIFLEILSRHRFITFATSDFYAWALIFQVFVKLKHVFKFFVARITSSILYTIILQVFLQIKDIHLLPLFPSATTNMGLKNLLHLSFGMLVFQSHQAQVWIVPTLRTTRLFPILLRLLLHFELAWFANHSFAVEALHNVERNLLAVYAG